MEFSSIVQFAFVAAFTIAAMVTDLRSRRIPNWLTVSAFVVGVVFHTVVTGWHGTLFALGGFAVGFGVLFVLWSIGGGGGGDVKLMGALGAWLGAKLTVAVFLLSAFMAFFCLLAVMGWGLLNRQPATAGAGTNGGSEPLFRKTIPYAIPAGLSAWMVLVGKMLIATT